MIAMLIKVGKGIAMITMCYIGSNITTMERSWRVTSRCYVAATHELSKRNVILMVTWYGVITITWITIEGRITHTGDHLGATSTSVTIVTVKEASILPGMEVQVAHDPE